MESRLLNRDDFEEPSYENCIGIGGQGIVYKLEDIKTHKVYAVKVLKEDNSAESFLAEMNLLLQLNYPTLIHSYGLVLQPCYLIMEYCPNHSVQYYIKKTENQETFTEEELNHWDLAHKLIIILGISFGIEYLHSQNIIHRDLKPENVLLDSNFYPKICDFGLAKDISNSVTMTTSLGTPLYAAPEQLSGNYYDGKKADSYSFGMTIYSILNDKTPFSGEESNNFLLINEIKSGRRPKIEEGKISKTMEQLIRRCWDNNPDVRPCFDEISKILLKEMIRIIENKEVNRERMKEIEVFVRDFCKRDYSQFRSNYSDFRINEFTNDYKEDINYKNDPETFSSLHYAAKSNSKENGEILISKGEDVNAKDFK